MRRLASVLAALALVLSSATIAGAHVGDCTHTSITVFEAANLTGDSRTFCGHISDLNNFAHTQSGNCDNRLGLGFDDWDDCISSWRVNQNDHAYCIGIYGNPGYITPLLEGGVRTAGYWSNMDGTENNTASSFKWTTTNPCPTNS